MKFGMQASKGIMDCCGLHGFFRMPTTKEEFEEEVRKLCETTFYSLDEFYDDDNDEYINGPCNKYGAMVIITTSDGQTAANAYLPELGWTKAFSHYNSNSGNIVHLWVMDIDTFNEKWGAY